MRGHEPQRREPSLADQLDRCVGTRRCDARRAGRRKRVRPPDDPFLLGIEANWDDPGQDEANIEWARDLYREMEAFSPGGAYLNFPGFVEEGEELLRASYGESYARLQEVKAKYDPENFFRSNFNITGRTD